MPEHPRTGRSILVAAVALFAAAAAQAAPKDSPAKHAGDKDTSPAISLDQLGGTWKNAKSGVNVRIEHGAAGWEVWFSTSGEARISLPEKNRPAIKIEGRNFTCSYSVILPTAHTMKWDLTRGQPEAQCLTGVFTRVEPAPSEAKSATPPPPPPAPPAKQAGTIAPAAEPAPATPAKQAGTIAPAAEPAPSTPAKRAAKIAPAAEPAPEAETPPPAETAIEPAPAARARPLWAPARMTARHASARRRPPAWVAIRYRGWRSAAAARWQYAASRYRLHHYYHYGYRWYVVFMPRCGCR